MTRIATFIFIFFLASVIAATGCSLVGKTVDARVSMLCDRLKSENPEVREKAAYALGKIGPDAKNATSDLTEAAMDEVPYVRATATWALGKIDVDFHKVVNASLGSLAMLHKNDPRDYLGADVKDINQAILEKLGDKVTRERLAALVLLSDLKEIPREAIPAVIENLGDEDVRVRYCAANALGEIGPDARESVPALIKALSDNDFAVRLNAASSLGKIKASAGDVVPALIHLLQDDNEKLSVRVCAAEALGRFGPEAAYAAPDLVAIINTRSDRLMISSAVSLINIGLNTDLAYSALIKAVDDSDTRFDALRAMHGLEHIPSYATPALMRAFEDQDKFVRMFAANTFEKVDVDEGIINTLIVALGSEDLGIRGCATEAIGAIGPAASSAVPELIAIALSQEDVLFGDVAVETLGKIGPEPEIINAFFEVIKKYGKDYWDSVPAMTMILSTERAFKEMGIGVVTYLIRALDDDNATLRQEVIYTLGFIGSNASDSVPKLIEILQDDPEPAVRTASARALSEISSDPEVISALVGALEDENSDVVGMTIVALGVIGPKAKAAIPALIKMLKDVDPEKRAAAAREIARISSGPDVVSNLISALDDPDASVHTSAASSLARIGPPAEEAIPKLIDLLRHDDSDVRSSAAQALGKFGPAAKDAIPDLIELLDDSHLDVIDAAAEALGSMGSLAEPALPKLRKLAKKDNISYAKGHIKDAIRKIETSLKH